MLRNCNDVNGITELAFVEGSNSLATNLLHATSTTILLSFSWLTLVIIEDFYKKVIAVILGKFNKSVIDGILVLLKPSSQVTHSVQVVGYSSSIMDSSKVCTRIRLTVGLLDVRALAQQVLMRLG